MTAGSAAENSRARDTGVGLIGAAAAGCTVVGLLIVAALGALGGASLRDAGMSTSAQPDDVSALAHREIPAQYLRLYEQAAEHYGLDWAILAGIGRVECDHGRDPSPSCTQEGAVNSAGAGGPMQFIASTWAKYGVDGDGDGRIDRWDPADAIYSAANYLRASGAPSDYGAALYVYNHSVSYVTDVELWATRYGGPITSAGSSSQSPLLIEGEDAESAEAAEGADLALEGKSPTPVRFIAGEHAQLAPGDGHLALVPAGVPALVQAMVVAGNELQALPYGPGGHPDPLGALEEDCSSTVNYVLYRSGVRPLGEIVKDNPLAQDYVDWGAPGPGRWVTIYASAAPVPHVFITIAGLRLDTSHNGTDVGPNRNENGPRWRILDHIPTWAKWSIRHPPGL